MLCTCCNPSSAPTRALSRACHVIVGIKALRSLAHHPIIARNDWRLQHRPSVASRSSWLLKLHFSGNTPIPSSHSRASRSRSAPAAPAQTLDPQTTRLSPAQSVLSRIESLTTTDTIILTATWRPDQFPSTTDPCPPRPVETILIPQAASEIDAASDLISSFDPREPGSAAREREQ